MSTLYRRSVLRKYFFHELLFFIFSETAISVALLLLKQRGTQALSPRQGCSSWRGVSTPHPSSIQPACIYVSKLSPAAATKFWFYSAQENMEHKVNAGLVQ
jgi:hypothetical protein